MNFLGLIVPDELVVSIAMAELSDLSTHVQILLGILGLRLAMWLLARAIDLYDYLACGFEKRQEIQERRRWFKRWRG